MDTPTIGTIASIAWWFREQTTIRNVVSIIFALAIFGVPPLSMGQAGAGRAAQARAVHSTGADWHIKGEGVVCCPCAVPCPCRTNGGSTYGHCEATLYLRIAKGHYGPVSLDNFQAVDTSGSCGMSYEKLSAIYLDKSTSPEVQQAFLQLLASFSAAGAMNFPYVREVPIHAQITDSRLYQVSIPDILTMAVDRYWGLTTPPLPPYAAQDRFANALQYIQNIRYRMHDDGAHLNFDYSRRQANYRSIDLDAGDYLDRHMLIQYLDGSGWFNASMLQIIKDQHLQVPDLPSIRSEVARLRATRGGSQ
jgi:hypothetical protein